MEKSENYLEEAAKLFHKLGRETYENMGYNNFAPMLVVLPEEEGKGVIGTLPISGPGMAYSIVQQAVMAMDFTPSIIAFTSDMYGYKAPEEATEEELKQILERRKNSSFKEMFEGGDPNVSEQLITVVLTSEGSTSVTQLYKYTPSDGFEWAEEISSLNALGWDWERLINGKPRLDDKGFPMCPKCGGYIPNNSRPGEYPGALSRRDNKTEICSDCGTREALVDFARWKESE